MGNILATVWYTDVEAGNIIRVFEFAGQFDDCGWRLVSIGADDCLAKLDCPYSEISEIGEEIGEWNFGVHG